MHVPRRSSVHVLLALLLLGAVAPVQADHEPEHTLRQVLDATAPVEPGLVLGPYPVPLLGGIHITGTGPRVDSVFTGAGMDCIVDDDTVARFIAVECTAPASVRTVEWVCLGPLLRVDVTGGTQGVITGFSGCADVLRSCSAYGPAHGTTSCMEAGISIQPLPMRCQADYVEAGNLQWTVLCTNGDP